MRPRLMVLMLMAGGALFAETHVAIGVRIGRPAPVVVPAPVAVSVYRPPCPGPGYIWIEGYYDEYGDWYEGYWALPPYAGAYWIAPRIVSGHFHAGYWGGPRGFYRAEPRFAPHVYERGHDRGFDRPAMGRYERGHDRGFDRPRMERYERGFRERGNGPDRGPGRGGEFRNGFRR